MHVCPVTLRNAFRGRQTASAQQLEPRRPQPAPRPVKADYLAQLRAQRDSRQPLPSQRPPTPQQLLHPATRRPSVAVTAPPRQLLHAFSTSAQRGTIDLEDILFD
ncbi:hypothetical protein SS50377_20680 [Spironucleus salmonicida]|uniref:Uncharacterized protein n=1 Tax=Spironucleus salmonicida TaxID=348837 RepID=V6M7S7_9EUKA|nr:hypothetical protein SS50377_20680 [Spironucleus salmonicida]|eukprot:EST49529.1 Hypothetical protein SS50377_10133 [Spironucleus salmonicida]